VSASGTPAATGPAELLSKVRGLYGDRLQSVGREVRTLRDPAAEREETLLLGQLHELRAAAAACAQSKWCVVLGCCGESVAVCGVQKPLSDDGVAALDATSGAIGSAAAASTSPVELLLFDPCARPVSTVTYSNVTLIHTAVQKYMYV
jgi:hypothetical protein